MSTKVLLPKVKKLSELFNVIGYINIDVLHRRGEPEPPRYMSWYGGHIDLSPLFGFGDWYLHVEPTELLAKTTENNMMSVPGGVCFSSCFVEDDGDFCIWAQYNSIMGQRLVARLPLSEYKDFTCGPSPLYVENPKYPYLPYPTKKVKAAKKVEAVVEEVAEDRPDTPEQQVIRDCKITATTLHLPDYRIQNYAAVKRLIEDAGGKWKTNQQCFVFDRDPQEWFDNYLNTGKKKSVQQTLQAFFTPDDVCNEMVELAGYGDLRLRWLEPSAGDGQIVKAILRKQGANADITTCEIDGHNVSLMQKNTGVNAAYVGDFLLTANDQFGDFDRIVMNPPFTKGQDAQHVMHAWKMLRKGGVLVAIMSSGANEKTTGKYKAFHALVKETNAYVQELPANTFKDTPVKTIMIKMVKK